ncbi:hypothetical protein FHQ19_09415 [Pasteurellaceae bacterium UScroc12]|nr:hypothetical protein FHQ19_09415 [Pasteurellaceae bacterium UScroc12]
MSYWIYTSKGLPKAEGAYLCAVFEGGRTRELVSNYSKSSGFHFDKIAREKCRNARVYAWSPYIPAPMHIDYYAGQPLGI